jgi:hypothetical protein
MATRASGYAPDPLGRYYTPAWAVGALLHGCPLLEQASCFWDPCAGAGHILAALDAMVLGVLVGSDIAPDPERVWRGAIVEADARSAPSPWLPRLGRRIAVITNPPYGFQGKLATEIITAMLAATEPHRGLVAMLLRDSFEGRPSRNALFDHPAAAGRIVLTDRIRWENVEQKKAGPSQGHVWWVWDWNLHKPARPPRVLRRSKEDGELRLRWGDVADGPFHLPSGEPAA